jgi:hypothetical protein
MAREINPFQVSGPLRPEDMIDRDGEAENLFALADGGHSARLVAPRRYGKTTLLGRVLRQAGEVGLPTALVDLHGVLTMGAIVVRIERAYAARLKGPIRRAADALLRSWNIGLSLGGGGFTASLQSNPKVDAESVLLRLLDLPAKLAEKTGKRSVIAFDEIQDLLRVEGADGVIRSVIQYQVEDASYIFAGSAPSLMRRLFEDPSRPLLEHALPIELAPLPIEDAAAYIEERFRRTRRDPGDALTPLVSFARGHPQRTMLLAHHLWEITPRGSTADETAWIDALERGYRSAVPVLRARWEGLPVNEQRLALALASGRGSIYEEAVLASVGLKRGSVDKALAGLEGRGEVMRRGSGPELTDPFLDYWLEQRGTL